LRIEAQNPIKPISLPENRITGEKQQNTGFSNYLAGALDRLDGLQKEADDYATALATGDIRNLHNVMIASEKAEIALQFTLQIRNKIIEAYQEIMRMQI
jgi:flagellar hook-basal body complex protein FliE